MKNKATIISIAVLIFLKWQIVGFCYIRGNSMSGTLCDGDYIFYVKSGFAFSKPERNDICLFNPPANIIDNFKNKTLIKRCVGEPGDQPEFRDTIIICKGISIRNPSLVRFNYILKLDAKSTISSKLDCINNFVIDYNRENSSFLLNLTNQERESLLKQLRKLDLHLVIAKEQTLNDNIEDKFQFNEYSNNIRNTITINLNTNEKQLKPQKSNSKSYNNGYYFIGDNRPFSIDSRVLGSITRKDIKGKAIYILFGKRNGESILFRKLI